MIVAMYFIVQPKDKGIWRTVLLSLCASRLSQRVRWPTAAYLEDGLPCCQKKKRNPRAWSSHNCRQRNLFKTSVWIHIIPSCTLVPLQLYSRRSEFRFAQEKNIIYYKLHFLQNKRQRASDEHFCNNPRAKINTVTAL